MYSILLRSLICYYPKIITVVFYNVIYDSFHMLYTNEICTQNTLIRNAMMIPMSQSKSKYFPDNFYRVTIKGIYVRDGKILLQWDEINKDRPQWELPGGGLDYEENFHDALKREVKEEMGLEVTHIADTPMYMWPIRVESSRNMGWFYVLFLGYVCDFVSLDFTPTPECTKIEFFSKEELQDIPLGQQLQPLRDIFNPEDFASAPN